MRRLHFALLSVMLVLAAQPLVATTYYVGSCKGGAYGTINAAVAAVPSGSTINVCPGTYAEQVVISKELTLQGISSNNSSQAVIAMPGGGLATTSSIVFGSLAAQVEVTAGPVKITNIIVDGAAANATCPSGYYAGIFYRTGSSGTVNRVEARNQNCNSIGTGILVENGVGAVQSVTLENNDVHDDTAFGIYACSNQTPSTLTAYIKNNYVGNSGDIQIGITTDCNVAGSVSDNVVAGGLVGIYAGSPSSPVSGNTVNGGTYGINITGAATVSGNTVNNPTEFGIALDAAGTVLSNRIANSEFGIYLGTNGATVKSNIVTNALNYGIFFDCHTGTVSGNTVNGAPIGLDFVPASYTGTNTFFNVATVRQGGC